ncbi:MAG: alcohol dehydrogenase catalytic domain-containing protein [Candidatus Eremiobacteraeota bacterium]|nr:alcohol dehydrogenase catalytic domain-containing protein [Candidatus Eremiobacteraeota bacterium]
MQAAYLTAPRCIELRETELPHPAAGAVVVRVRAALTDGTDLKAYRRGHPQMPVPTRFGHEFSGDIIAVGEGVQNFAVGDAIMSVHSAPCGDCYWCGLGEEELCESVMSTKILGAYADYIEIPAHIVARNCYRKPSNLSYRAAAFLEPLACVVHSLDFLNPKPNASVAVLGDGGFGLLHALLLQARGMRVILIGRRSERMQLARDLGVHSIIDARIESVQASLNALTENRGADALIECTGSRDAWESAPSLVRRGGIVSLFGGLPAAVRVSFLAARLHYDEVRLISPFHFTIAAVRGAYELLAAGKLRVEALITQSFSLGDIAQAFSRLDAGEGIKFSIEPAP